MTSLNRPHSLALDKILGQPFAPIPDTPGFLRVIDYMGDEAAIVQAARVSYGKGTKAKQTDVGLIRYLMRHRHTTPFEMCEIKFHVKLPIFVARQWLRHRMASVNEYSARYSILKEEFYLPDDWCAQSEDNKQGSGHPLADGVQADIDGKVGQSQVALGLLYQELCGHPDEMGYNVAREQARIVLPLSTYTEFYWKIDLHNLLHFLSLRADSHAQKEIRLYAETILELVGQWLPAVRQAFTDYRLNAVTFSGAEVELLRSLMYGRPPVSEIEGHSPREVKEFNKALGLLPC